MCNSFLVLLVSEPLGLPVIVFENCARETTFESCTNLFVYHLRANEPWYIYLLNHSIRAEYYKGYF